MNILMQNITHFKGQRTVRMSHPGICNIFRCLAAAVQICKRILCSILVHSNAFRLIF
jgi:hypothetical protein